MKLKFIISGGGTGGHIYPAIAIANELQTRFADAEFLFVGAKDRMEMEKVPQAGYKIKGLWISGLQRSLSLQNLAFPLKLVSSLQRSNQILREFKPNVAIGTGGYASAALLRMASLKSIPCLIQEQNSYAGMTNKWLAPKVQTICVAYEGMEEFFPAKKLKLTGNPVRQDLLDISLKEEEGRQFFNLKKDKKTVLVLGGSLGARRVNQLIEKSLSFFDDMGLQLIWQCGKYYEEAYKAKQSEAVKVHAFLNRMDLAYAAADFIVSRAGALSVSELCLVGKPVVFIPSPNVAEDHQTKNALSVSDKDAAIVIAERDLDSDFETKFSELVSSEEMQMTLSENIKKMAKPNATKDIVNEIEKLLKMSL